MIGEKQVNKAPAAGFIHCHICGETFYDLGNHPLTCGKRDCAIEAGKRGWWTLTHLQQSQLSYDAKKEKNN